MDLLQSCTKPSISSESALKMQCKIKSKDMVTCLQQTGDNIAEVGQHHCYMVYYSIEINCTLHNDVKLKDLY